MNNPYHRAPQLFRDGMREGPDAFKSVLETVRFNIGRYIPFLQAKSKRGNTWSGSSSRPSSLQSSWRLRSLVNIRLGLIVFWIITLKWGEVTTFNWKVQDCAWDHWESWVGHGRPGHASVLMVLVASWRNSASCHSHRRPSNSGPSYLSWPTLAFIYSYHSIYRFIPSEVLPAP